MPKKSAAAESNEPFESFALLHGAGYDKDVCLGPHKKGDSSRAYEETS